MEEVYEDMYQQFAQKMSKTGKGDSKVSIQIPSDISDANLGTKYLTPIADIIKSFTSLKEFSFELKSFRQNENDNYEGLDLILNSIEKHLPKLEVLRLNISSSSLQSQGFKKVLQTLKHGAQVNQLSIDFSSNSLEDAQIIALRDALRDFKSLESLNISLKFNSPSNEGRKVMGEILDHFSYVSELFVDYGVCSFDDESIPFISEPFKKFDKLTKLHLDLTYSYMKKNGVSVLVEALEHSKFIPHLTEFKLFLGYPSQYPITVTLRIAKLIKSMPNLEYLSIDCCEQNYEEQGIPAFQTLLESFCSSKKLQTLDFFLHINYIGSQPFKTFASQLKSLENLKRVGFQMVHNQMGDEALINILDSLCSLKKLEKIRLQVQNNKLTHQIIPYFNDLVKTLPQLSDLDIEYGSEDSQKQHFEEFIHSLKNASHIKKLRLEFNEDANSRVDYDTVCALRDIYQEINNKNAQ